MSALSHVREWMTEGGGGRPGHGEDDLQGSMQGFRNVDVAKARRVGDDGIGHKGRAIGVGGVRGNRGLPRRFENLGDHLALPRNILAELFDVGRQNAAARAHHIGNQLSRVCGQWEKLDAGGFDKLPKLFVRGESNAVAACH